MKKVKILGLIRVSKRRKETRINKSSFYRLTAADKRARNRIRSRLHSPTFVQPVKAFTFTRADGSHSLIVIKE